jgi:spore coat protein U-like protein
MNTFRFGLIAFALLASPPAPNEATAATTTSTFQVTATVVATCTVASTDLAFGNYTAVQADQTSTITVTCTNSTPYTVALGAGTFASATPTTRRMTGPAGATLAYSLYRDAARTLNWGQTVGTDTASGTGNGAAQAITVYGRIAAGQFVAPGAYADTITVTLTY